MAKIHYDNAQLSNIIRNATDIKNSKNAEYLETRLNDEWYNVIVKLCEQAEL